MVHIQFFDALPRSDYIPCSRTPKYCCDRFQCWPWKSQAPRSELFLLHVASGSLSFFSLCFLFHICVSLAGERAFDFFSSDFPPIAFFCCVLCLYFHSVFCVFGLGLGQAGSDHLSHLGNGSAPKISVAWGFFLFRVGGFWKQSNMASTGQMLEGGQHC